MRCINPLAVDDKEKVASLVKFYGQCYRVIGVVVAVLGAALMPFLHLLIDEPNVQENIYLLYGLYLFNAAQYIFFQLSRIFANGCPAKLYCYRY